MAEAMTVETILEADLLLRGFWTRVRFPFQTAKGGWSDIDVLGYQPERRELVLAESKVRGPKKEVYAFTRDTKERYGDILKFDDANYFSFLDNVAQACDDGVLFKSFAKMVGTLTIQVVSNYYIAPECRVDARETIAKRVRPSVPTKVKVHVELETTLDVIARVIREENKHEQGRRHGNAMLDIAREINRYMHPNIRYAGHSKLSAEQIRKDLVGTLQEALIGPLGKND
jgi:hypothetical protein